MFSASKIQNHFAIRLSTNCKSIHCVSLQFLLYMYMSTNRQLIYWHHHNYWNCRESRIYKYKWSIIKKILGIINIQVWVVYPLNKEDTTLTCHWYDNYTCFFLIWTPWRVQGQYQVQSWGCLWNHLKVVWSPGYGRWTRLSCHQLCIYNKYILYKTSQDINGIKIYFDGNEDLKPLCLGILNPWWHKLNFTKLTPCLTTGIN